MVLLAERGRSNGGAGLERKKKVSVASMLNVSRQQKKTQTAGDVGLCLGENLRLALSSTQVSAEIKE